MATPTQPTRKKRAPAPSKPRAREALQIHSMSLTPTAAGVLTSLASEASDRIGRSISTSAVLRAILTLVEQRIPAREIFETIEREVGSGRLWGSTTEQQRIRAQPRATTGRARTTAKT